MDRAERIVQDQVDAYNARDLQRFLSFFAEDATVHAYPDHLVATGKAQIAGRYARRFDASPQLHARILSRMVMPPYVVDHEWVTGLPDGATVTAIVIYEVRGDRIVAMRALTAAGT